MLGRFTWLCLLAAACAGAPPSHRPEAKPVEGTSRSAIEDALSGLELTFVDPATLDLHRTVGPYRILRREAGRVEIEGVDALARGPSLVTLIEDGEEIWAWTRVGRHEFLARIR